MWLYEKKLEHPVRVTCPDVKFAKMVITQYGGLYHIWYNFQNDYLYCIDSSFSCLLNTILSMRKWTALYLMSKDMVLSVRSA